MFRRTPLLITARRSFATRFFTTSLALSHLTTQTALTPSQARSTLTLARLQALRENKKLLTEVTCSLTLARRFSARRTQVFGQHRLTTTIWDRTTLSARARRVDRSFRTPVRSFSPRPPLASTAGARTQSSLPNSSSTDRTASRSAKDRTSTPSSRGSTTHARRTLALTFTRSPFAQKSTSHRALATSRVLTTPPFSSSFPTKPSEEKRPPRFAYTPLTTMFSVS